MEGEEATSRRRFSLTPARHPRLPADLFKRFNGDIKRTADLFLSKAHRVEAFDVTRHFRADTITNGMLNAVATGNWNLKRFRMERAGGGRGRGRRRSRRRLPLGSFSSSPMPGARPSVRLQ